MLAIGAQAVLTTPLRSSGVLSALVLALSDELNDARKRVARLELKLQSANQVNAAKLILMSTRNLSDEEAYKP